MRCVYAHVYAQTVHTCASHEKMFISYMDVQTCMARKTASLHVHRMGGSHSGRRGPGFSSYSLSDLEQAPPPLPQFFLCTMRGLGEAHFDLLHIPVPGSQESSWTLSGPRERMVYSEHSHAQDPSWAAGLGCCSPGLQEARGPFCPSP